MKNFLIVGTDGQSEQTGERRAESADALCAQILEEIRTGTDNGEWEPHSYVIYEIVGRVAAIDVDAVETATVARNARIREEYKQRREADERRDYERLRKKFEGGV